MPNRLDIPRLTVSSFIFSGLLAGLAIITLALQPILGESLTNTLQVVEAIIGIISICFGISYWVYKRHEKPIPAMGVKDFRTLFPHIPDDEPEIVREIPRLVDFEKGYIVTPPNTYRKLLELLWIESGEIKSNHTKEQYRFGILAGPSGCGKTVTALKMGYDLLQKKWNVFYCEATELFASNSPSEIRNWIAALKGKILLIIDNTHLSYDEIRTLSESLTHIFQETNICRASRFRLLCIYSNVHFMDSRGTELSTGQVGNFSVTFFPTVPEDDSIGLSGLSISELGGIKEIIGVFPVLQITEGREIAETIFERYQQINDIPNEINFENLFEQTGTVVELCEVLRSIRDTGVSGELIRKDIPRLALARRVESITDKAAGVLVLGIISVFSKAGSIVAKDFLGQIIHQPINSTIDELVTARHLVSRVIGESMREYVIMAHPVVSALIRQGSSPTLADFFGLEKSFSIDIHLYEKYIAFIKTMPRTASKIGSAFLLALSSHAISKGLEEIVKFVTDQCDNYHSQDRNIAMCLFNASSYYLKSNHLNSAESLLQKTINLAPDFVQASMNLGIVYYFKGELAKSRDILEGVPNDKRDASFYGNLGIVLYEMGMTEEGIDYLQRATTLQPQDARYWHNLAKLEMDSNRMKTARQHFTKAIEIDSQNSGYYVSFSKFYLDQGFSEEAEDLLQTAINHGIVTCNILINLGIAHKNQGRFDNAKNLFIECIELNSADALAHANLADILHKEGNRDDAQKHLRESIKNDPDLAGAYGLLGLIYQEKHMLQKAKKAYETAISKGYEIYEIVRNLAFVYHDLKRIKKFDEKIKRAEELSSSPAIVWLDASVFLRKKNRKKSRKFHEKVTNFVNKCIAENNPADAEETLARLSLIHPTKYEIWANLGAVRAALGKFSEAKQSLEKAIELELKDPRLWHNIGNVYKELGLSDKAEDAYQKARKLAGISEEKRYFDPDKGWNLTS